MMAAKQERLTPRTTDQADIDLTYWQQSGNQKMIDRINRLISAACENPFQGIGKPERLKFEGGETYSRRINKQHRLVYRVEGKHLIILAARFHYLDR